MFRRSTPLCGWPSNTSCVQADIANVTALVPHAAVQLVCEPKGAKRRPHDSYAAQFSTYFTTAAALVRRRFTLDELEDEALRNPDILSLADRVDYAIDDRSTFPRFYSGAVVVTTRDGRRLEAREDMNRGAPERPMSEVDIVAKFTDAAERVFTPAKTASLADMLLAIDKIGNVASLVRQFGRN